MSSTEVTKRDEAVEAILAQQQQEFTGDLHIPILKIGQALTREVSDGAAVAGEFINTLTGEGVGTKVGLIVAAYSKGRAGSKGAGERYYTSNDHDIIPEHWADFVGEEWVNARFDEHPDADEMFRQRVNRKDIEWGSGPMISTTHNYTGLCIVSALEDSDEEFEVSPVRLSLKRTDMSSVRRINSMFQMKMRNKPLWSRVLDLSTEKKSGKGTYYGVTVGLGRETTAEEQEMALDLAQAVFSGRVTDNSDKTEAPGADAPSPNGGLSV